MLGNLDVVGIKFREFEKALDSFRENNRIVEIENVLDREYYGQMLSFAETIPSQGRLFRKFLEAGIETNNVMNVLRLRNAGIGREEIIPFVIGRPSARVKTLLAAETKDDIVKALPENITESAAENFASNNSLVDIELEMNKNLLKRTTLLLHQHPLTVDVILGYMFAKEIEVRNLKMLLKARQLSLSDHFIEQQIII